jgi:2-C-methyl-D-erythritol 2,4-cyclodiphosphate synthase
MDLAGLERSMRVGIGYDVHVLAPGETLIIGGVMLEHDLGTVAHSDGDVLTHAIIDALLGAIASGDIGSHFPDTDERWKGADSIELLKTVSQKLADSGFRIGNIDSTVALQRPRLRPHIDAMRSNIAGALGIPIETVSVKATTTEGLGPEGRQEGVTAYATCLVLPDT